MPVRITLRVDRLERLQSSISSKSVDQVRDSSKFMRQYAQTLTPVRTGALRASWYVSGPLDDSEYPSAAAQAASLNPLAKILMEVRPADIDPGLGQLRNNLGQFTHPEAIVSSAVNYSLFLEEGTRYMAPRPILRPAIEATRDQFVSGMKNVAD